jgi:peptide/nickel transport system permease protein
MNASLSATEPVSSAPQDDGPITPRSRRIRVTDPRFLLAAPVTVVLAAMAILSSPIARYDPTVVNLTARLGAPDWFLGPHFFGTDATGRDIWSLIVFGSRVSLLVSISAALASAIAGISLGLIGSYVGRSADHAVTFLAEAQLSLPYLLVAVTVLTVAPAGISTLIVVLALTGWPTHARIVRSRVVAIRHAEYIEAAHALGAGHMRIVRKHVVPNIMSAVIVIFSLQIASFITAEATLSFLGLGVPPNVPSWGSMVSQGQDYVWQQWWLVTIPGLAIVVAVVAFSLLGDWLRDQLDPKLRV